MSKTSAENAAGACIRIWMHRNGEPMRPDGTCWWCGCYRGLYDEEGKRDRDAEEEHKTDCPWTFIVGVIGQTGFHGRYVYTYGEMGKCRN